LYLLGIASPTHPIPAACWYRFDRQPIEFGSYKFFGRGPLFTHQYSQAWLHLAGLRDGPPLNIDYFQNSVTATYANRAYCFSLRGIYPGYSDDLWASRFLTATSVIWPGEIRFQDATLTAVLFVCVRWLAYVRS